MADGPWNDFATLDSQRPAAGPWAAYAQPAANDALTSLDEPPAQRSAAWTAQEMRSTDSPLIKYPLVAAGTLSTFAHGAVQQIADFFKTGIKAASGQQPTPEEEISAGLVAAGMTSGGFMKPHIEAIAPVAKSFDDGVIAPAATRLDSYARTGDPNGVRLEPPIPEVKPAPIRPIEGSPFAGVPRSVAAKTVEPEVDSVLGSPITKSVIDHAVIDRSHDVPYMAGGSNPLNDPTVYIDRHVPKEQTIGGVTFDPAEPWSVHENVEQHTMEILTRNGMTDGEAYRVAHFEFAEPAEQAWYRAHGIDQVAAEKEQATWLPRIQHEPADNPPPNLYEKPYPHMDVRGAEHESVEELPPTPEEKARAFDIIRNAPELRPKSAAPMLAEARELGVIGMDAPENINLAELARRDAATPAEQAFRDVPPRSLSAAVTPEAMRGTISPREPLAQYEARFKDWISKIDAPGDVSDVIERAARENDLFPMARDGEVPASHVAAVAEAAGLDPKDIDRAGLATRLDSDAKVRAVVQALRHTTRDFIEASKKAAAEPTEENAAAALEAQERQKYVTEYTLGFRAESGRTLNAWKDLLRETERSRAVVKIKADEVTGKVPTGVSDVVDAAGELRSNLSNPTEGKLGLQKLIDAAERLVTEQPGAAKPRPQMPPELADLVDNAKKAMKGLKPETEPEGKSNLQKLVDRAEKLVAEQTMPGKSNEPLPPDLAGLVDEAKNALKGLKAEPEGKSGLQKLVDAAERLVTESKAPAGPRPPLPADLAGLVDAAKKTMKGLKETGLKGDAELEAFRKRLTDLSEGSGSVTDTADAARKLVEATKKTPAEEAAEPKTPSPRGKLIGMAKKLIEAQDGKVPTERGAASPELAKLSEATRLAAGYLKEGRVRSEITAFRDALEEFKTTGRGDNLEAKSRSLLDALGELKDKKDVDPRALVEIDKITAAAKRFVADSKQAAKDLLPPDLKSLVDDSKSALAEMRKAEKTQLEKTITAAENQVKNAIKQKTVRKPADALPPEWQALVDKADFVTKRFGGIAKGEEAAMLLARAGRTAAEQAELARGVEGLTPNQVARVLERLRKNQDPHWLFWSIQQGLISGLITHTKYAFVNTAQTFLDRVVAPEIAAIMGKVRGQDTSLLAPIRAVPAMFGSIPDALAGVRQAFKTGMRVPLESELRLAARGEANPEAAGAQVPYGQQANKVNWGIWKKVASEDALDKAARIIGIPGRSANSIHTFFKIMNERASLGSRAWEMAEKEAKPGSDQFWDRYQHHLDNPTDANLRGAVEDGYAGTFMEKLGEQTEKTARLIRNTPFKWLVFFTHIPFNMIRAGIKNSPLALLNMLGETKMGSALKGELGPEAQNLAYAHVAVGTAVGGYFIHKALSGEMNGDFPTDQKEKNRWKDLGIQPNTVKMDGQWVSMDRLGPIGMVARLSANYAHIFQHYDPTDDHAMMKATFAFALGTAKVLGDDVGFETVRNIVDVMENPREAARFAAWQLSSYAMPISLITQTASAMDPNMRVANSFVDGFKYHLPYVRETLPAKRDPIYGEPVPNPGYHSILRSSPINTDPVKNELDRLQYYPTAPERTIGHVKLTDEQYDRYEATAGPFVKQMLNAAISGPRYAQMPDVAKQALLKGIISAGRARARQAMQMAYPQLIQQGIDARRAQITGATP